MTNRLLQSAKNTFAVEEAAISKIAQNLDNSFITACEIVLACTARTIITGIGKSGHIARKIAATLASTGTPAFFVHPAEASHGDMGMITHQDVVIAISNSGTSEEILAILPVIQRMNIPLISMTGNKQSLLARAAKVHLDISVEKEACPLNLAPTSSTTATLVMGDALAVSLLEARGFKANDFAKFHPGGALGRSLLLRVQDIMHTGKHMPTVYQDTSISDAIIEMTAKGLGMTTIVNKDNLLLGIFTDGDLRRIFTQPHIDIHTTSIAQVMHSDCKTIAKDQLAINALEIMNKYAINALAVIQDNKLIGALNMHDLVKAKVL